MPALRDLDLGDDTATAGPTSSTRRPTLYFAYGSNLWLAQMRRRCPSSVYLGVARLRSNGNGSHWRWVINERGYANVVEIPTPFSVATAHEGQEKEKDGDGDEDDESDVVYGIVYALPPAPSADEESLDAAEGVPIAYGKEYHAVDFWPCCAQKPPPVIDGGAGEEGAGPGVEVVSPAELFVNVADELAAPPQRVEGVLVYVDRLRTAEGVAKEEYVGRMNEAVRDAVALGVPRGWVERCVRRFIPAE
ncbi:hypothetical protein BFW01_g3199 [Lasiodiplodia theobromae]|nr:hypothetical protein BFW01_g3199 [Lasiodiplodia theobromae]